WKRKKILDYGVHKLKKLKFKYFSDKLKKMYRLCELFLDKSNSGKLRNINNEYILVKNYNIVFEDMIDKLLTEETYDNKEIDGISLDRLKKHKDGKVIDHIYDYKSII